MARINNHYEQRLIFKKKMLANSIDLNLFDVHDAKIICNLTQHSKWNRTHHLFLLCYCKPDDAVKKAASHKYKMITDEEHASYYNKFKDQFKLKCDDDYCKKNMSKNRDWCDEKNRGFTHFGIHPKYLPLIRIDSDNLHCLLSIVLSILNFFKILLIVLVTTFSKIFILLLEFRLVSTVFRALNQEKHCHAFTAKNRSVHWHHLEKDTFI